MDKMKRPQINIEFETMEGEQKELGYMSPIEWHEVMNKAKESDFKDEDSIGILAGVVNSFRSTLESDAFMITRKEFTENIPERFHWTIKG